MEGHLQLAEVTEKDGCWMQGLGGPELLPSRPVLVG